MDPEKWDLVPTDEDIDKLAPLIGGDSLHVLVELGMDFQAWEEISHRQTDRDLVKLNRDILEEWKNMFCKSQNIRPTLRKIAQAFQNTGKSVKMVENVLFD